MKSHHFVLVYQTAAWLLFLVNSLYLVNKSNHFQCFRDLLSTQQPELLPKPESQPSGVFAGLQPVTSQQGHSSQMICGHPLLTALADNKQVTSTTHQTAEILEQPDLEVCGGEKRVSSPTQFGNKTPHLPHERTLVRGRGRPRKRI